MKTTTGEKGTLKLYLLGLLPAEGCAPLEERLLTDAGFYEELSIAEDELIDLYLAGDLDAAERESFETHFLCPAERVQKLRLARSLRRYVNESAESSPADAPARGWWERLKNLFGPRPALAFSLAVAVLLAVSLFALSRRVQTVREAGSVYAVGLTPGLTRESGETQRITIPHGTDTLRLRLELPADDYPAYRAEFLTAQSRVLHTGDGLKAADLNGRRAVEADVPSELVAPGDYQLKLYGLNSRGDAEPVGRYYLRVNGR
ncbi:MAG TPA: hypothetical protein VGV38_15705 [Pyrinomonadaceae bacterium]|nr:hypothetical protein [Pyrinomonadaceae bacterium]